MVDVWWLLLAGLIALASGEADFCAQDSVECNACPSHRVIALKSLDASELDDQLSSQMFFIESANRTHLLPRQACSVESALRINPGLKIVVAMTSDTLDLASNATCHLYAQYGQKNLIFRHVDPRRLAAATPLENLINSKQIHGSEFNIVQLSDAIRLLLVWKYGGLYSDLDLIFKDSIEGLHNFICGDHNVGTYKMSVVANAIYHFEKHHSFLERAIRQYVKDFDPNERLSGGPPSINRAFEGFCQIPSITVLPEGDNDMAQTKCAGQLRLLGTRKFFPVGWFEYDELFSSQRSEKEWEAFFRESWGIHFYNSLSAKKKIMKRKHYGQQIPALLYLGLKYCPIAVDAERLF